MNWLGAAMIALAALPLLLACINAALLVASAHRDRRQAVPQRTRLSILIPARNEERNIEAAIRSALATSQLDFEVLVMDDASTDRTPEIVERIAAEDQRVRLLRAPPLPQGWSGKAHALQALSKAASGTHLLFMDADVRLLPEGPIALLRRLLARGNALVSAVPRQQLPNAGTLLTVPLINFLLLGYYPLFLARLFRAKSLATGCGQLMLVEASAYAAVGGHAPIRHSLHDGITLPRLLRKEGFGSDLAAGWQLATCTMYASLAEAWHGFAKNAREGLARPLGLPVWTLLLVGGHVLPPLVLSMALASDHAELANQAAIAWGLSLSSRCFITLSVRERWLSIVAHPATVLVSLAIQWQALLFASNSGQRSWKGRIYQTAVEDG